MIVLPSKKPVLSQMVTNYIALYIFPPNPAPPIFADVTKQQIINLAMLTAN